MKCPSCKKENIDGVKFCKYCGSPLAGSYKTCANGHNYESNLSNCPFCPSSDYEKTMMDNSTNIRTIRASGSISDKTIIDTSAPTLSKSGSFTDNHEKTVIFNPDKTTQNSNSILPVAQRKLVAWLVTYDINPNGTDFRIFEGRTKIGKHRNNDIVINQSGVSDEHAVLLYREIDKKFVIQDSLSTNGTFVNKALIDEKVTLHNDDIITLGKVNLKLKII